jgi:parallel beta-helix repeat protein
MKTDQRSITDHTPGRMVLLVSALLIALPMSISAAAIRITTCPWIITEPGVYVLTEDLTCDNSAIIIEASDVDLHLAGHTISGKGSGNGVEVNRGANVRIHHGTLRGFNWGILLNRTLNSDLDQLILTENKDVGIVGLGTIGARVTGTTANRNGREGLSFGANACANTLARNTCNQNGTVGITLFGVAVANNVTDNTANENGDAGIDVLAGASGNTVSGNVTDHNTAVGIQIVGEGSIANVVKMNTATANGGEGIRVFAGAAQNLVQQNTCRENFVGIRMFLGANQNTVVGNHLVLNFLGIELDHITTENMVRDNSTETSSVGIWLDQSVISNTVQGNKVHASSEVDLKDDSPSFPPDCLNTWIQNTFQTRGGLGQDCIQ